MPLKYWLPPTLWMIFVMWLSSDIGSAEHTEHWLVPLLHLAAPWATPTQLHAVHGLTRKAGHLSEYAILAALWYRGLARGRHLRPRRAAAIAFVISVIWAVLDETHQSFVPTRTASAMDVALDATGAGAAMLVAARGWRETIDRTTILLLWIALIGGAAFLTLNAATGVPSGLLWLTVPLAAVLLIVRALYTRHHPGPRS